MDFNDSTNELKQITSLTIDKQIDYFIRKLDRMSKYKNYILANKPIYEKITAFLFEYTFLFKAIDADFQNEIVFANLLTIKLFAEDKQRLFMSTIKDHETFRYLFNFLKMLQKLEVLSPANILDFMSYIKDPDLFIEIYQNPNIFKKLMQKTKIADNTEVYWYGTFNKLPISYQEYILKDLKDKKEYNEQFQAFYQEAKKEAKITILDTMPKDFIGLIDYYSLTHDPKAKESFMARLNSVYITSETFSKLLSLYPLYLTIDEMAIIIDKTNLFNILISKEDVNIMHNDAELTSLINNKIKNSTEIQYFVLETIFLFCFSETEKFDVMAKISKDNLLSQCHLPEVMAYFDIKLKEDKNYLKDAIDMDKPWYRRPIIPFQMLNAICPHLSDEAFVYYAPIELLDEVIIKVEANFHLINYVNDNIVTRWLDILDNDSPLLHQFPSVGMINSLASFRQNPLKRKAILNELYNRCAEGPLDLSGHVEITNLYNNIDDEEKGEFIAKFDPRFLLECYTVEKNEELKEIIAKTIIQKSKEAFDFINYIGIYKFLALPEEDLTRILFNVSPDIPIRLFMYKPSKILEQVILRNVAKNPFSLNTAEDIDELVYSLGTSAREKVNINLQGFLNDIKAQDVRLYELFKRNDSYSVLKFVERYKMGFFADELRYNTFVNLLTKYPFITITINYDILSPELINLNSHFLDKIVKYPDVQARIINIKTTKAKSYPIFLKLLNHICADEDRIFDNKMVILLAYFEKNEVYYDHELSSEELENLLRYIFLSSKVFKFSEDSLTVEGVDPLKYSEEILQICDRDIQKANSVIAIKNAIFKKYFDITYEDAKVFLYTFDNDLADLALDEDVLLFVDNIRKIVDLKSVPSLLKIYQTSSPRYSINDMFIIINELQKAFAKKINDGLTKKTEAGMQIPIGGEMIRVIDAGLNFKILTHSTNAYSAMPMIDDDYDKSWNLGKNLINHGICTSLVTDTCLGFTPLKDARYGVIFGFNHIAMNAITNMGPYDLVSVNNGYLLDATRIPKFMTVESMERNTRHTHNEIVLERTNLENNSTIYIQPDYVIITSEMSENQKQNSLLASKQMNKGKGIPILYIDIAKIIANKKETILSLLADFTKTKDINTFSKALSIYESIKCTSFNIQSYDFIATEDIDKIITEYIEYAASLTSDEKIARLQDLEKALDREKAKFDLIVDSGNRYKSFDINYVGHIENIYNQLASLSLENDIDRLNEYMIIFGKTTNGLRSHGEPHMLRVTMLAQKIAELLGLDEKSLMIIIEAAKNHDKGRNNDGQNKGHAQKSAMLYKASSSFDEATTNKICAIIEYHEEPDNEITREALFDKYHIPLEDRSDLELLCAVVKDADALDRVRFINSRASLDVKKLRLKESKLLIKYAKELLAKTRELNEKEDLSATIKS